MLTVENASLHYGAAQALRGISLEVKPQSITCVLGRNGVGKTSMLRALRYPEPRLQAGLADPWSVALGAAAEPIARAFDPRFSAILKTP